MSLVPHIPEEIWAETFVHLPRTALPQVNLTHRTFHRITRPLLFRHFEFHPYMGIAGYQITACPPSGLLIPYAEHMPSLFDRLQFWSSPVIVPLVRTCRVSGWPNNGVDI
ncbi:hypothetical protein K438DRAFT_1560595, partial [Mycena galopus ATCC 62051]